MHHGRCTTAMKRNAKAIGALAVALIVVAGAFLPHFVFAQGSVNPTAQLQSDISVATSAKAYATGLLVVATDHGLDVNSAQTLMASGNASLTAAQAEQGAGNTTAGIQDAQVASQDYAAASVGLGLDLQNAGLTASAEFQSATDAIASANATATAISAVIVNACTSTSVNATYASTFAQECAAGRADIAASNAALAKATIAAEQAQSGQAGVTLSASGDLVTQAQDNISAAANVVSELAAYTYTTRGQAFVNGPFTAEMATANASVQAQQTLATGFTQADDAYQSSSANIDNGVNSITTGASATANAIASISTSGVTGYTSTQESTLATIQTNLVSLKGDLSGLPAGLTATINSDIAATQASLTTYNSAIETSGAAATSYSQVTLDGFAAYSNDFQSDVTATQTNGQTFLTTYATLQGEVSMVADDYPLLTALAQVSAELTTLGNTASSTSTNINASLQATESSFTTLGTQISATTNAVQTAQVQLSESILQSVSATSSAEQSWLNSTAASAVVSANTSIQATATMAADFSASSQALLQAQLSSVGQAAQGLSSQGAALKTQAEATIKAMASANVAIQADLQARIGAVASAKALASEAMSDLSEQQVSAGASLLIQASAQLQIASESA
jgi:hypothetical protein